MTDAEAKKKPRERLGFAGRYGQRQLLGQSITHAIHGEHVFFTQQVEVGNIGNLAAIDQLRQLLLAKTLDIHGIARNEMLHAFDSLGRAVWIIAARHHLFGAFVDRGIAFRALCWQWNLLLISCTLLQ